MMRMSILEILIIIVSIVYIWEHSGFMYDLSKFMYEKLNKGKRYKGQPIMKPFGCYTCMIMWVTTIHYYIYIQSNIIFAIGVGVVSSILGMLIDKLMGIVIRIIYKIE